MKSLLLILLLLPAAVLAQEESRAPKVGNPHGDMNLDCALCHTEQSWDEAGRTRDFDHSVTGFPLEGLHQHARCRDCHFEPVFAHVGTSCVDCHQDIHLGREGPVCSDCHTPDGWVDRPQMRREHDATALPLVGAHAMTDCGACHAGPVGSFYVGTPIDCYDCHSAEYLGTTEPDHQSAGFGTDCIQCHGVFASTWGSGDFIHSSAFPLTGAHRTVDCLSCHGNGYEGTPTDCVACHQDDYDGTNDPDHRAALMPTDCRFCHTTTAWEPAFYNHDATAFPLTGAHRNQDCLACHATGYTGTPSDCVACHRDDYDRTNDPDHLAANFPTTCAVCHSTTAWEPSTWDHEPLFPIRSGPHKEVSCTECHVVPTNYAAFECILCHEHTRGEMDPKHSEVDNYRFESSACYSCHPRGTH